MAEELIKQDDFSLSLHECIEKIIIIKKNVYLAFRVLGELLYNVKTKELYKTTYETFEEFLGDPEISFSRITAYKMIKIYAIFVKRLNVWEKVQDIDSDKLYMISDVVVHGFADDWIERARTLSRSDLRGLLRNEDELPELESKPISEHVKDFLYKYCPKKGIAPDNVELEELLETYEKWRRLL